MATMPRQLNTMTHADCKSIECQSLEVFVSASIIAEQFLQFRFKVYECNFQFLNFSSQTFKIFFNSYIK